MTALASFTPPGRLEDLSPAGRTAWSNHVSGLFQLFAPSHPQFYDPTQEPRASEATAAEVKWTAFPAQVTIAHQDDAERWALADDDRVHQDEYCEWSVERDANGKLIAVTFTSETPDYYRQLFMDDPERVRELYSGFAGSDVPLEDLVDTDGRYRPDNPWNDSTTGPIAHLIQESNNLEAAIALAALATVLRERDGERITNQQDLVECGGLGKKLRHSDPQIASAVNDLAGQGFEIALADPPGLYLAGLLTGGLETPDGTDPAEFWSVTRGTPDLALRARFAVPPELDYAVGDIAIDGQPIRFGGQLADRVRVKIAATALQAGHQPQPQPCVPAPEGATL